MQAKPDRSNANSQIRQFLTRVQGPGNGVGIARGFSNSLYGGRGEQVASKRLMDELSDWVRGDFKAMAPAMPVA